MGKDQDKKSIFGKVANYKELHVYQKAEILVLLTDVFCKRFLPLYGDRRVDQMNMAARCGKQNIVEGCEEGLTSSQMEVNLVNVGRASFQELREEVPYTIVTNPKYEERTKAILRALSFFREPATPKNIAGMVSRSAWGGYVNEESVDSLLKMMPEVEYVKWGKYKLREK